MTLYELSDEYKRLLELASEIDEDQQQTFLDTLESLDGDLDDKADSYAKVIRNLEADLEDVKAEIDRLSKIKSVVNNNITSMKKRLQTAMIEAGRPKIKTALFSFNIQKNPAKVAMDETDIGKIPLEYLTVQMPTINKTAIRDALKAGVDLTGIAHFEQDESLRIR